MLAPRRSLTRIFAALGHTDARLILAEALANRDDHTAAFRLFAKAARAGCPPAQYRLGRCYLLGLGVPPSMTEALRWLRRSADAGETKAETQLAALALQGVVDDRSSGLFESHVGEPDFARAEYWCNRAIAGGSAEAKALLAFVYSCGPSDRRDINASNILYAESAEAGWSRGQLGHAVSLLSERRAAPMKQAAALLRSASGDGPAITHFLLGMLAESAGEFVDAAAAYKQASELGHSTAQLRYGYALLHGRGLPQDAFAAETWLRRAALAGEAAAAAVVGYLYLQNGATPANYAEASVWLLRAAEAGHVAAARTLGWLLMTGKGTHADITEAARWLRSAADAGDREARFEFVRLALTQQIGKEDQRLAAIWLQQTAHAGDPAVLFDLGLCLAQGIGIEKDDRAAVNMIAQAAAGGHDGAKQMLAQLEPVA